MSDLDIIFDQGPPEKPTKAPKPPKPLKTVVLEQVISSLGIEMSFNQFISTAMIKFPGREPRPLDDDDEALIRDEMLARDASIHPNAVSDRLRLKAKANAFHPVVEYLDSVQWDGESRMDGWLTTYLGVPKTPYTRKVGNSVLVGAVRRVKDPGCKFDEALILIGTEGSGKSTAIRTLCPDPTWFSDSLSISSSPKQVIEGTQGIWLMEGAELVGAKNVEAVKAFLSRSVDGPVRLAYSKLSVTRPRQFVVIGTTNEWKPLANETGARRFWPVKMGTLDKAALERDRDQLWAEACVAEMRGDTTQITVDLIDEVTNAQNEFATAHPWRERIKDKLDDLEIKSPIPKKWLWEWVGVEISKQTHEQGKIVNAIMDKLGYEEKGNPIWVPALGKRARAFVTKNPFEHPDTRISSIPEDPALPYDYEEPMLPEIDKVEPEPDEPVYSQYELERMKEEEEPEYD